MKNSTGFYLFVIGLVITSCRFSSPAPKNEHDIFTDTLTYTYKTLRERAPDCGNLPDDSCTVAKIRYAYFEKAPALNDTIERRIAMLYPVITDKVQHSNYAEMIKSYMKAYQDFIVSIPVSNRKKEPRTPVQLPNSKTEIVSRNARKESDDLQADHPRIFFTLDDYAKVTLQDTGLVALEYGGYTFLGGAHGATFTGFINWNPKTHTNIYLKDIFINGYEPRLNHIADSIFRKDEKLSATASLETNYFFKDGKFSLPNNYSITPLGIKFLYNQYEIKPYAAGQTVLFIPYDKLNALIRHGSVVAKYKKI